MSTPPPTSEQMFMQQLAEQINKLTIENNRLQQQQNQQQQQINNQYQQSSSSSSVVNSPRFRFAIPQPKKPETFSGEQRKSNLFLIEVESYWDAVGGDEANPNEAAKVIFVAANLREGAAIWWQYIKKVYSDKGEPINTWAMFKKVFMEQYQPILASEAARGRLSRLKQRDVPGGVSKYIELYTSIMLSIPDKSTADQMFDFMNGLSPEIYRVVDMQNPTTLIKAQLYAIKAEANNQKIYLANKNKQTNQHTQSNKQHNNNNQQPRRSFYPNQHQASKSNNQSESTPMDLSNVNTNADDEENQSNNQSLNYTRTRVSQEEFDRCMRLRICIACKKPGHIARDCSKK
jgi:hypothetical protein